MDVSGTTETVLPGGPPPLSFVSGPDLAKQIRSRITPLALVFGDHDPRSLRLNLLFASPPAVTSFDIFVRFNGREHPLGPLRHYASGAAYRLSIGSSAPFDDVPPTMDVILRTNEQRARQTVDVLEIFNGEILYNDIPVQRGRFAPTTLPSN